MKRIFVLITLCSFLTVSGQQRDSTYKKEWSVVDSLVNRGLTQSASNQLDRIYATAKKDNNQVQQIKVLVYRMQFAQMREEDATKKNIYALHQELTAAKEPAKSILESLLAESYWNYFQQHRWQLYNRTQTINFNKDDVATWSVDDFHRAISNHYLRSIGPERLLKQTTLSRYDPIIVKGNARYLRPTLFDLLAHRALNYFKNDERTITQPAYAFEIVDPEAFADAVSFTRHQFTSQDSLSLHFKALRIFQDLIAFHLNDPQPAALIDVNIERLQFVYAHGVMENKDSLYLAALQQLEQKYPQIKEADQARYLIAEYYAQLARAYDPLRDTSNRYAYLKAVEMCERLSSRDSSEGQSNCQLLLQGIKGRELMLQTEKVNVPELPFRTLVSFRNVDRFYYRIVKFSREVEQNLGRETWNEEYWQKLVNLPAVRRSTQQLPTTNDHQQHRVEIKIDALPVGEYMIIASADESFSPKTSVLVSQHFHVSNLAFIQHRNDYFVLHRQTGQPIQAKITFWQTRYGTDRLQQLISQFTNNNGFLRAKLPADRSGVFVEIATSNDQLFLRDWHHSMLYDETTNQREGRPEVFLFTDRSIYRPGQTAYFKGIVVRKDSGQHARILPNRSTTIYLYDANRQKVDSLQVTSNEFGSYHGQFVLPSAGLTGLFTLRDKEAVGMASISVEEYKRPKFYVSLQQPEQPYKFYDTVEVKGNAQAYAGNTIGNASVSYRVFRQPRFPYPWLWRWGYPTSSPQEITHGVAQTSPDGTFTIRFAALPDKKIDPRLEPIFDYKIIADVTDISGETRSAESIVSVGYKPLMLSVALPRGETVPVDSSLRVVVQTRNMAGRHVPSKIQLSLFRLDAPDRLIRERYWPQPDMHVMSREEYIRYFPFDEYSNETDKRTWGKEALVFQRTDSSRRDSLMVIAHNVSTPGWYALEIKTGDSIKDVRFIQIISSQPSSPDYLWASNESTIAHPGDQVRIRVGTSANDVFLIQSFDYPWTSVPVPAPVPGRKGPITNQPDTSDAQYRFATLNNYRDFQVSVTAADRGGFGVIFSFVKHNRFHALTYTVMVPWTEKELAIQYETYRDKLLPGSEETWKVKITGHSRRAAEVLTTMYDASLDQFKPHGWEKPGIWPVYHESHFWQTTHNFSAVQSTQKHVFTDHQPGYQKQYDQLISPFSFGGPPGLVRYQLQGRVSGVAVDAQEQKAANQADTSKQEDESGEETEAAAPPAQIQIRRDFSETSFFFPQLRTDSTGAVIFSFRIPEALTQWKWMLLAHTKDLAFGYDERIIITQKELMVQPNLPRFLREGDRIQLPVKIANMSDKELTGQVEMQLIDAETRKPVDGWFQNMFPNQYFTAGAKESIVSQFTVQIPFEFNKPVLVRIVARAGNFSDGEENLLPVLTNRILVTETLPIYVKGSGEKTVQLNKLIKSGDSETLQHHALTVEYTSNPAWYAVQALPYLMEYPYECSEQIWNRVYANALAAKIANSSPAIKEVFEKWRNDSAALMSNLQKNEELKSLLLQETPWVMQANSESEQKKRIGMLFQTVKLSAELEQNMQKLAQMQLPNGAFPWFEGGPENRFITQYIVTGIGHLIRLQAVPSSFEANTNSILKKAIAYLDSKLKSDYDMLFRQKSDLKKDHLSYIQIHYLYMRSFFTQSVPGNVFNAYNFYRKQSQQFWLKKDRFMQGMIALSLHRTGDKQVARNILESLKQNAIRHEELGMYWKEMTGGYYWYQAPVESQALLIEAFHEISPDTKLADEMRTWLLKHKQTNHWRTTKATADACYAMLLRGSDWLTAQPAVQITLGNMEIKPSKTEAGTGYFKSVIDGETVSPSMGNINVDVKSSTSVTSWGAVYWQYFDNMENITSAATSLKVSKAIFVERLSDRGPVLEQADKVNLKVGDKVTIRIEIRVDRPMEYVHMKDMRAASFEPVNVLSGYRWKSGLGYYESTRDASTNFFFDYLPRGTHVFEYSLFASQAGTFSNGITTIQCMYAPEFASHSEGATVVVE